MENRELLVHRIMSKLLAVLERLLSKSMDSPVDEVLVVLLVVWRLETISCLTSRKSPVTRIAS